MGKDVVYIVSNGERGEGSKIISVRRDLEDAKRDAFDVQCTYTGAWRTPMEHPSPHIWSVWQDNDIDFVKIERHKVG